MVGISVESTDGQLLIGLGITSYYDEFYHSNSSFVYLSISVPEETFESASPLLLIVFKIPPLLN